MTVHETTWILTRMTEQAQTLMADATRHTEEILDHGFNLAILFVLALYGCRIARDYLAPANRGGTMKHERSRYEWKRIRKTGTYSRLMRLLKLARIIS